jgi:hypothetical protein
MLPMIDDFDDSVPPMPELPETTTTTTTPKPIEKRETDSRTPGRINHRRPAHVKPRPVRRPAHTTRRRPTEPKIPLQPPRMQSRHRHRRAREIRVYVDAARPRE